MKTSLPPGTLVRRGKKLGRVVAVEKHGRRAWVMWEDSWVVALSKIAALVVVF
jgi:hypothetical protein